MTGKILTLLAALTLFSVVGTIAYTEYTTNRVTVAVDLKQGEDPFKALKAIIPADSTVVGIRELDHAKNKYEVIVKTRRQRATLIDWIRSSSRVEGAEGR